MDKSIVAADGLKPNPNAPTVEETVNKTRSKKPADTGEFPAAASDAAEPEAPAAAPAPAPPQGIHVLFNDGSTEIWPASVASQVRIVDGAVHLLSPMGAFVAIYPPGVVKRAGDLATLAPLLGLSPAAQS